MSSPSIIRPEISVPLASGPVTVREMPGIDALKFFAMLAKHAKGLFGGLITVGTNASGETKLGIDQANIPLLLEKLEELVLSSDEIISFVLAKSCADPDVTKKYGTMECLALLEAALAVNLTEDHLKLAKKVGSRFAMLLPAASTNATPQPAIV